MTDPNTYQIRVAGWIGTRWSQQFEGMTIKLEETEDNETNDAETSDTEKTPDAEAKDTQEHDQ